MNLEVEILGIPMLSDALGTTHLQLSPNGSGIADLLDALVAFGGDRVRDALFADEGEFDHAIQIAVNGEKFVSPGEAGVVLEDGDRVTIMMLIGGG